MMNENMQAKYAEALDFWNNAFALGEDGRAKYAEKLADDPSGRSLASGAKLADIMISELSGCERLLDYGCGRGWAGLMIKKAGSAEVTAVDLSENAVDSAKEIAAMMGVNSGYSAESVSRDWLKSVADGAFDGVVCSNVLDVIPTEVAEDILSEFSRVLVPGGTAVIGLNYYMEPKDNPERNITVVDSHVFVDGILRMVTRTDEEWTQLIGSYLTVERLEHFGWTGEETERRRVFVLKK